MRSKHRNDLIGQPHTDMENITMKTDFPYRYPGGKGPFGRFKSYSILPPLSRP